MDTPDSLGLIWVAIAIAAAVVEVFTLDLIFLMVAGGALVGALAAVLTGSITLSILFFAVSTVLLMLGARPPLRRYMQRGPSAPMHTEALIGRTAEVVSAVDASTGRVKLAGEVWSARLESDEPAVAVGQRVDVIRIEGATAIVRYRPRLPRGPGSPS